MIGVTGFTYFIKADAQPVLSASVSVVANVVNVICKIIYLGPMKLGIEGAALGTITGYSAGFLFLLFVYLLSKKRRMLKFVPPLSLRWDKSWDIFITGLPSSLGQGLGAVATFAVNSVGPCPWPASPEW